MVKACKLKDLNKHQKEQFHELADACIEHEEWMNTRKHCLFISTDFFTSFKNAYAVFDETHADGIRGVALLHMNRRSEEACISHLYVPNKHRHQGIARSILLKAVTLAQKSGKTPVLKVNPLNTKAISIYKRFGFTASPDQAIKMEFKRQSEQA